MQAREELALLLDEASGARRTNASLDLDLFDVRVTVDGLGTIRLPVTPYRAKQLRALSEPAPYGKGEQTLTDVTVRDTGQIPIDKVSIEWGDDFEELCIALTNALGLPAESDIRIEPHSMLVYGRGQFFAPHQDSEKADGMIASLVVQLPSAHTGGDLIIHETETTSVYRGSRDEVSGVAFYADLVHEVTPVRSGYRISLTFNVFSDEAAATDSVSNDDVGELASLLRCHFEGKSAPVRLAYLLDHQYTERGFSWARLKGVDAERATLLRAAAEQAECVISLGLLEVHEDYQEQFSQAPWSDWYDDETSADPDDEGGLGEVIDTEITLTGWRYPATAKLTAATLYLSGDEVCSSTPNHALSPFESEYTGYMGNYGNTIDRWYRRACVLVLPARLAYATKAEIDPRWAVDDLRGRLRAGDDAVTHDLAALKHVWPVRGAGQSELFASVLELATLVEDEEQVRWLLAPFSYACLRADSAPTLLELARRRGPALTVSVIEKFFPTQSFPGMRVDVTWFLTVPEIATVLRAEPSLARAFVAGCWREGGGRFEITEPVLPSTVERLTEDGALLAALLRAAGVSGAVTVLDEIEAKLLGEPGLIHALLPALALADQWSPEEAAESHIPELRRYAIETLRLKLAEPVRDPDDWRISASVECGCLDCAQLNRFLHSADRQLEWPLATQGRRHLHVVIDRAELPVTHQTRRRGRPYTLVLTKTAELKKREDRQRSVFESALGVLTGGRQ